MGEDLDPVCDRCGHRKSLHRDVQRFCPFYSTFRAAPRETGEAERLRETAIRCEVMIGTALDEPWPSASLIRGRLIEMRTELRAGLAAPRPDVSMRQEQGMLDRCPIDPNSRVGRFFATLRVADVDEGPET